MTEATLSQLDNGDFQFQGELVFESVPELLNQTKNKLFASKTTNQTINIDLQPVRHSDSAGVAFLIELIVRARQANQALKFVNIPSQMMDIAKVSGVTDLLNSKPEV